MSSLTVGSLIFRSIANSHWKEMVLPFFLMLQGVAVAADASPNYFKYFPGSPLSIGGGFIQNDLSKQFVEQCLTGGVEDANPGTGALYSDVEIYLIRDYESLLDKMNFDARISAHSPTAGFDAGYREQRDRMSEANSLTAIVQVSSEFSPKVLKNPKLGQEYLDLLKAGLVDDFVRRCGSRVVVKERRGVQLSAVITISNVSLKIRQQIDASLGASYGAASFSAEAKAVFNKEFATASTKQRVDIKLKAIGGEGAEAFEQAIKSTIKDVTSLDGIGEAISTYAKTLTKENAGVLGSFVADMPLLDVLSQDPWIDEKQLRLVRLKELYLRTKDRRDAIGAIVAKSDPRWVGYPADRLLEFQDELASADSLAALILKIHTACKGATELQYLSICIIPPEIYTKIDALSNIPLIGPPYVRHAVLVRTGSSADVRTMSEWGFSDERAMVRMIDRPPFPDDDKVDFGPSPRGYRNGFFKALPSEVANATRAAVGVLLTSENLEQVVLKFVADQVSFKPGYSYTPRTYKVFGSADLASGKFDPPTPHTSPWVEEKRNYFFLLDFDYVIKPPAAPIKCFGTFTDNIPECKDYNDKYGGDIRFAANLASQAWPWVEFVVSLAEWVGKGEAWSGSGRYVLVAKDRFGGQEEFNIMTFSWDVDRNLQLVRVLYGFGDGDNMSKWYMHSLGPVSESFPNIIQKFKFTGEILDNELASDPWPTLEDKWHEFRIKYCPSVASGNLPARVETDRRTARVIVVGHGKFDIDILLNSVAEVERPSMYAPNFYESDAGCH